MNDEAHNEEQSQSIKDWLVTEQLFKESGLEESNAEAENNEFLHNFNAIGRFLASYDAPTVQFAQFTEGQTVLAFDEEEPIELPSPFFPADDEKQLWVIRNIAIEDLESFAFDAPQISSMTAYGYNKTEKMMLFNLEEQRYLGINGTESFARSMVLGLAVEHIMEPWNASRVVYFVGFGTFGAALKQKLNAYHANIRLTDQLTDLEHDRQSLDSATIFCLGHDARTLSEFVKSTADYKLALVADTQLGGTFTYFQEGDDDGALEPGNVWIQPFLMEEDSEDYQKVMDSYQEPSAEAEEEEDQGEEPAETSEAFENIVKNITDEELNQWLNADGTAEIETKDQENEKLAPATDETTPSEEPAETKDASSIATPAPETKPEPAMPNGYLQLMADKPQLVAADGTTQAGFPAQVIAYTYLQQTYGQTTPTFADLCKSVWNTEPTGKDKSKLSARRKRAKEKLSEFIPEAELTLTREGWSITNLITDIDLLKTNPTQISPAPALSKEPWAKKFNTALEEAIKNAQQHV